MLCRALGGPTYSFTAHGPYEFERAARLGLGQKTNRAAFAVTISADGQRQLRACCAPAGRDRVHLVRGALDLPACADLPPVCEARRFVCVGRLSPEKGFADLLEAAQMLGAEGEEFDLTIVGDGPLRRSLQDRAAMMPPRVRVEFTGWASEAEVRRRMIAARALVLPSLAEGLPVVLMEAMALGRPVIASRIAGVPELVEDRVSGWLVPPASPRALADALRQALAAPPEQLAEMGRCARRRVAAQHDGPAQVAKLDALFRAVTGAPGGGDRVAPARYGT
jgi:glycosyltransferase involved in cell wall biosynthesis